MYTSPEEARSDLFLSGAVYLLGPIVIDVVLAVLPLGRIPVLNVALAISLPLVTTVLVPFLLIRYRDESFRDYGFGNASGASFGLGVLVASPLVVATVISEIARGGSWTSGFPVLGLGPTGATALLVRTAALLATWLGLALLAVYVTAKARDAFRSEPKTLRDGMLEVGRWLVIAAAAAIGLLLVAVGFQLDVLLLPLAVLAAALLAFRTLRGPSVTTRATLLTPVILLALGPFAFTFRPDQFVVGLWLAALSGGIGLTIATLVESRRSGWTVVALGLTVALFTQLGFVSG